MIKFFRKIRYDLMDKNKTGKYFKYAIGEIVLVVIGILIALQINNWNENRKIEDIKQNYYQQLLVDLEKDKEYAEVMISVLDSSIAKHNNYRKTIEQPFINFDTTFKAASTNSFTTSNLEFKTSSIKSLLNTGDIKLLEPNLRDKLNQYNASKNQILNLSKGNNDDANSILKNAMMSGATAYYNLKAQPELINFLDIKNKLPETFIKLEAYLTWKIFGEKYTTQNLKILIEDANIIIDLINKELEK
jgi:hypothetical protein